MPKLKNIPENERPREKLLSKGTANLADEELLAILLGKGTRKCDVLSLAKKMIPVIDEKGDKLSIDDLTEFDGIGTAKATIITAAFEFVRRRIKPEGLKIKFPADVLPLIRHYGDRKQEHFLSISINGANEVMNIRVVTIGLVNKSHVHPREVFAEVLSERASGIIIAHNHPVGSVSPSKEDVAITESIKEAGKILGINFLDHIIFNQTDYYSFAENDKL